jgi:membrane associated rhomboid family serine protease
LHGFVGVPRRPPGREGRPTSPPDALDSVFLPVTDSNTRSWIRYHYVTLVLIAACTVVYILQIGGGEAAGQRLVLGLSVIPAVLWGEARLTGELYLIPAWTTLATSMFLHGSWMHLGGNMLFLWVFGDNVEDAMGHQRFLGFYLLCGIVAALAHAVVYADSQLPVLGASGAVSGVLGAYFVLHPRVKIWIVMFALIPMRLPTWIVIGGWAAMQLAFSVMDTGGGDTARVAWFAHVAGFAAGALLVVPFRLSHVALWDQSDGGSIAVGGLRFRRQMREERKEGKGPWG